MVKPFILTIFFFVLCIKIAPGSNVYSDKRGRPQYSSLIPFPRVGRSSGSGGRSNNMWYYGQKRGGKSGLIPFPRVGRSGARTWDLDETSASHRDKVGSVEYEPPSSMRSQSVGKLSGAKQLRSWPPRRDGFKRRITRSYWDRRILRSLGPPPEHSRAKKQSLIPFPRTGKRSLAAGDNAGLTPSKEENQIYVYENDDDEDPEFYETEADVMDGEDNGDLTMDEDYEDSLGANLQGRGHSMLISNLPYAGMS